MERKDYLVCLKGNTAGFTVFHSQTTFEPHKKYRCCELSEGDQSEMLIGGVVFDKEFFDEHFEYLLDKAKRDFEKIGLLKYGQPISKTAFKELADVHKYGKGKSGFNIAYFSTHPKECMYAFFPQFKGDSKAKTLNNAYEMFIDFLNGESDDYDCGDIQFCNTGIPLSMSLSTKLGTRFLDSRPLSIF